MTSILITGGTGSFGRTLTKKLIGSNYERIIIYSRDEHKQERMERELGKNDQIRYFIGDIRDKDRLRLAMRGCWTVVHTAAIKIVSIAEYNPMEAIKTNIIGAQNLIDVALENLQYGMKVLALSTDKAINPLNLYGATKLCAEKLFLASNALAWQSGSSYPSTRFSICRYGNVANSNGSVIKVFQEQIKNNEPLTITDENMTRYWIELDEAVEFVINCLGKMKGGEVFIPDMPSFKIIDLAYAMEPSQPVKFIGIRPGEKIHEQIDQDKFSNINESWLTQYQLKSKLKSMGII